MIGKRALQKILSESAQNVNPVLAIIVDGVTPEYLIQRAIEELRLNDSIDGITSAIWLLAHAKEYRRNPKLCQGAGKANRRSRNKASKGAGVVRQEDSRERVSDGNA